MDDDRGAEVNEFTTLAINDTLGIPRLTEMIQLNSIHHFLGAQKRLDL